MIYIPAFLSWCDRSEKMKRISEKSRHCVLLDFPLSYAAMGFSYRKSIKMGAFRVNVSKSGVGYSVGGKGFRTGRTAKGRTYSAFNVPGTGVRYTKSGCLILVSAIPVIGIAAKAIISHS